MPTTWQPPWNFETGEPHDTPTSRHPHRHDHPPPPRYYRASSPDCRPRRPHHPHLPRDARLPTPRAPSHSNAIWPSPGHFWHPRDRFRRPRARLAHPRVRPVHLRGAFSSRCGLARPLPGRAALLRARRPHPRRCCRPLRCGVARPLPGCVAHLRNASSPSRGLRHSHGVFAHGPGCCLPPCGRLRHPCALLRPAHDDFAPPHRGFSSGRRLLRHAGDHLLCPGTALPSPGSSPALADHFVSGSH